ncbi:unnamed protein product [Rotaria sp. Silwood2]|nr:unnamed protein product [Rotaria sp. Silwood2]
MEHAYNELKRRLTTSPIFLNFPDDKSPLVLSTDASGYGMGGVLRQTTPEGSKVETDHCPLCSFNKKKFQNSRIERWQLQLSEYDITTITYQRGKCNCDADLVSRFPYDEADIDDEEHPMCVRHYT